MSDYRSHHDAIRISRKHERSRNRKVAEADFEIAQRAAERHGIVLMRKSDSHYQIRFHGCLLNVYPGNRRLYHDKNHKTPPRLKLPSNWTIIDVINTIIQTIQ